MKRIYCDIETDGLNPTKIWCCVCKDCETGEFTVFRDGDADKAKEFFKDCSEVIGHNFINFDMRVLNKLWNVGIKLHQVTDTIILSRLFDAKGIGHSLKEWGERLGEYKDHHEDWSKWSQEMEDYCKQDVNVTAKLYQKLAKVCPAPQDVIRLEHSVQFLLERQREYGFLIDVKEAIALKARIDAEYMSLIEDLKIAFPPRKKLLKNYVPRYNKDGAMCAVSKRIIQSENVEDAGDGTYNIYEMEEFNIDSPTQIVERLEPYWHPVVFNKPSKTRPDYRSPKVCIENIETVNADAPEAIQKIVRCKIDKSRSTLIESFLKATDDNGRMHGTVISIGAATHRMAHTNPNTANVPSRGLYGDEIRALFKAAKGYKIVGVDASGIQLRALCHYIQDEKFRYSICHGDQHAYLATVYGLLPSDKPYDETIPEMKKARSTGKTVTFCIIMGGGAAKVGLIVGGDEKQGKKIMNSLKSGLHGFSKFKMEHERYALKQGYRAIDGRWVRVKNAHLCMSSMLQSFESCIVKWVMVEAYKRLTKAGIDFHQVAVVHDEIQYEVKEEQAEELGKIVEQCFRDAGERFKSFCPLDGEAKIGNNWKESH